MMDAHLIVHKNLIGIVLLLELTAARLFVGMELSVDLRLVMMGLKMKKDVPQIVSQLKRTIIAPK